MIKQATLSFVSAIHIGRLIMYITLYVMYYLLLVSDKQKITLFISLYLIVGWLRLLRCKISVVFRMSL